MESSKAGSTVTKLFQQAGANKLNLFYSLCIIFNHFAYGIGINILSVTLVDLRFIYGVSLDAISYVQVAPGVGYLLGACAGWLYKWVNRQMALTVFVAVAAVTIALVPFYPSYPVALFGIALHGIGGGAWYSASGYWMVEMWPEGNAAMLQIHEFMYGAGMVFAPLLVAPYVYGEVTEIGNQTITAEDRVKALTLPYALAGILQAVVPILWILLFFTHPYKDNSVQVDEPEGQSQSSYTEKVDPEIKAVPESASKPYIPNRKLKLLICGLAVSMYSSSELGWFGFSTALYQYLEVGLDAASASKVSAILSGSYTVGRLATAVISIWVIPDVIICYHFAVIVAAFVGLIIGRDSYTWIVISNAILGYGFSAVWPAMLAFVERHLRLSDRICSIYSVMLGIGSLVIPLVMGVTFYENPMILYVLVGGFTAVSFGLFCTVYCWIYVDNWRHSDERKR